MPVDFHSALTETIRQRQMLDLDQLRNASQKSDGITFTELIWADDELFEDEWLDFSKPEESDFWSGAFEENLLTLK